jgi:large subunit ribosomal protein L25
MQSVKLIAQERPNFGKSAANNYRRDGLVPCVLYAKDENILFNANPTELKSLIYTPDFKLVDIEMDGKSHRCILKEIQFHPLTDAIIHIDFLKLVKGSQIKVEIPLRPSGAAIGVKSGGKLVQKVRTVKIKTTPEKLVSEILIDVTNLDLGQSLRIRDIVSLDGVAILNTAATPIFSVEIPRALKSATTETAAPAKAAAAPAAAAPKSAPAKK